MIASASIKGRVSSWLADWLTGLILRMSDRGRRRGDEMSQCPGDEMLAAFVEHCLRPQERQAVEEHIADCRLCRKIVVLIFKIKKAVPAPVSFPADHQ
jgi:hypothetical protein